MKTHFLADNEMFLIRGGDEPVRPIAPPRDRYDDEEQAQVQTTNLSHAEEALNWVEWLKNWLGESK
ncbi:MAG TPA: hypothetical protein DER09_14195 [Prolixibacteraceae bacterium]|nr:hypothetical protein [Prolixibacteraceae bacterium]